MTEQKTPSKSYYYSRTCFLNYKGVIRLAPKHFDEWDTPAHAEKLLPNYILHQNAQNMYIFLNDRQPKMSK